MEQVLGQWISEKELGNTHYMKAMRLNIVNQGDIFNGEIINLSITSVQGLSIASFLYHMELTDFSSRIVIVTSLLCLHISLWFCVYVLPMQRK